MLSMLEYMIFINNNNLMIATENCLAFWNKSDKNHQKRREKVEENTRIIKTTKYREKI